MKVLYLITGIIVFLLSLFAAENIFYQNIFSFVNPSFAFVIFYLVLLLVCLFFSLVILKKRSFSKLLYIFLITYLFSLLSFQFEKDYFHPILHIIYFSGLLFLINIELGGVIINKGLIEKYSYSLIVYFLSKITGIFNYFYDIFAGTNLKKHINTNNVAIFVGFLLLATPIALIVIILLGSINSVFQDFFNQLINILNPFLDTNNIKIIISLIVLVLILGDLYFIKNISRFSERFNALRLSIDPKVVNGLAIILGSIILLLNIIYLIFVISEFKYDFGNLKELVQIKNLTSYSSLATSRFWELIIVSGINLSIIYFILKPIHSLKSNIRRYNFFRINSFLILLATIFLCFSASQRLLFYEQAYGFSTLRIISHSFVIIIALICLLFSFGLFKEKLINRLNNIVLATLVIWLALIYTLPTNYFSYKLNFELYKQNKIQVLDDTAFQLIDPIYVGTPFPYEKALVAIEEYNQLGDNSKNIVGKDLNLFKKDLATFINLYEEEKGNNNWVNFNIMKLITYNKAKEILREK